MQLMKLEMLRVEFIWVCTFLPSFRGLGIDFSVPAWMKQTQLSMNQRSGNFRRLFRYCHFQHLVGLKQHLQPFQPFAPPLHPSSDVLQQLRCINNKFVFPLKCSVFVLLLLCWRTKNIIAIYPFYQIQSGFGHCSVLSHHFHLVTFQTINK